MEIHDFNALQVPLTDPFFKEMFQTRVNTYPYIQRLHSTAITEEDNCTMLEIQVCVHYFMTLIFNSTNILALTI